MSVCRRDGWEAAPWACRCRRGHAAVGTQAEGPARLLGISSRAVIIHQKHSYLQQNVNGAVPRAHRGLSFRQISRGGQASSGNEEP